MGKFQHAVCKISCLQTFRIMITNTRTARKQNAFAELPQTLEV